MQEGLPPQLLGELQQRRILHHVDALLEGYPELSGSPNRQLPKILAHLFKLALRADNCHFIEE